MGLGACPSWDSSRTLGERDCFELTLRVGAETCASGFEW
jgi:hypothetical protein